jgi:hypothetical protein
MEIKDISEDRQYRTFPAADNYIQLGQGSPHGLGLGLVHNPLTNAREEQG